MEEEGTAWHTNPWKSHAGLSRGDSTRLHMFGLPGSCSHQAYCSHMLTPTSGMLSVIVLEKGLPSVRQVLVMVVCMFGLNNCNRVLVNLLINLICQD